RPWRRADGAADREPTGLTRQRDARPRRALLGGADLASERPGGFPGHPPVPEEGSDALARRPSPAAGELWARGRVRRHRQGGGEPAGSERSLSDRKSVV